MADPNTITNLLSQTPLLSPFNLTTRPSTSQSALLRIIHDEILAFDAVLLLQNREDKLHSELTKARNSETSLVSGAGGKNGKSKKKKRNAAQEKISQIETQLNSISSSLLSAKQDLAHLSNFTRSALQCEYSKLVVTLNPDSPHYHELERSVDYLFNDEDRCVYFREMVGVLKKVRAKNLIKLNDLPLIKQFQCENSSLVESMVQEVYLHSIAEELHSRPKDGLSSSKLRLNKYANDSLEATSLHIRECIAKHYRKKSIKLHPDRVGEEYRSTFEQFTKAKDILSNTELRLKYLVEMSGVVAYYPHMLPSSHEAWIGRHVKADESEGVRNEEIKRLEGGLLQQCLKAPLCRVERREKCCRVEVSVVVPKPMYEFYSRVRTITVHLKSTHGTSHTLKLHRPSIVKKLYTDKQRGCILQTQLYVGNCVLDIGYWDIRWMATLDAVGTNPTDPLNATTEEIDTTDSYSFNVQVQDRLHIKHMEQLEYLEGQCKIIKGQLNASLHKLNTSCPHVNRYACHETLVRAAKMHRKLKDAMDKVEKPPTSTTEAYNALGSLLESSRGILLSLEDEKLRQEKKDDVRRFKAFIARVLESEKPLQWMETVQPVNLEYLGGDVNRLYQLFIEGKGKCALLIDSEMLHAASLRTDIFSSKQCKELLARSEAAAIVEQKEEEDSRAASERQQAEEEERSKLLKEAEQRKKWEFVGNVVTICGLQSDAGRGMNGKNARVLYYVKEKDRYEIEILGDDESKKVLLKKENLSVKYFGQPDVHPPTPAAPVVSISHVSNAKPTTARTTTPLPKAAVSNTKQSTAQTNGKAKPSTEKQTPTVLQNHVNNAAPQVAATNPRPVSASPTPTATPRSETTIYVASTVSKKLTGKRGRSKKALEEQSGSKLEIQSAQASNGYVPVLLAGTQESIVKAKALIEEAAGSQNVRETIPLPNHADQTPTDTKDEPIAEPVQTTPPADPNQSAPSDSKTNGSEANPRQLFPPGFSTVQSNSSTATDIPSQLPSEIGIRSNHQREPMTDGSVSSLNDRSHSSRTPLLQQHTLPENDPLLSFLRGQQSCIKGNPDEFFLWLVKSEDVDSIAALKEAVSDEDYLADSLKNGNGLVGLKGFKRKAFQRAVLDHQESHVTDITASTTSASNFDATDASVLRGIESSAFLPSFLYSDFENHVKISEANQSKRDFVLDDDDDAPPELVCPITHELMVEDPVLAADGVTYERSAIENWFHQQVAQLKMAQDLLQTNPHLRREQELVRTGICSPLYGTPIPNLCLTPNTSVRNMARAHRERTSGGLGSPSPSNVSMFRFANLN